MHLTNGCFAPCLQSMLEFVQGMLTQRLAIELTLDFELSLVVVALVPMAFWPAQTRVSNVLIGVEFTHKFTGMGAQGDPGLARVMHIEDGIGVLVEDTLAKEFQGLAQAVNAAINTLMLALRSFHLVLLEATDVPNIMPIAIYEELSKLTPQGVWRFYTFWGSYQSCLGPHEYPRDPQSPLLRHDIAPQ